MSNEIDLMRYLVSGHNGNLLNNAVDTINSFVEDKEHFTVWLYDEEGHSLKLDSKLTAVLMEFDKEYKTR